MGLLRIDAIRHSNGETSYVVKANSGIEAAVSESVKGIIELAKGEGNDGE